MKIKIEQNKVKGKAMNMKGGKNMDKNTLRKENQFAGGQKMTGRPTLERLVFTVCPGRLMNSVSNMSRMVSHLMF